MNTRSGSIDPGILIHLLKNCQSLATSSISLNRQSGLKGISGVFADMRQVFAAGARGNSRSWIIHTAQQPSQT